MYFTSKASLQALGSVLKAPPAATVLKSNSPALLARERRPPLKWTEEGLPVSLEPSGPLQLQDSCYP